MVGAGREDLEGPAGARGQSYHDIQVCAVPSQVEKKRTKTVKIDGEDPGSPDNPKMLKKFIYCTGITTVIFVLIYLLIKFEYLNLRNIIN